MADAFIGEIRIFCGNFIPAGWAACNGATMQIRQETALYAVIGTRYGGDGKTTFMLPDLQGKVPLQQGAGTNLTQRELGEKGGTASVALTEGMMPRHTHRPMAHDAAGDVDSPSNALWAQNVTGGRNPIVQDQFTKVVDTALIDTGMAPSLLGQTGGDVAHNNMQPYLPLLFMICVNGVYPIRP